MIQVFSYKDKRIEEINITELDKTDLSDKKKSKIWVVVKNAEKKDMDTLADKFNIHPTTLEDMFSPQCRIKYEEMNDYTFIVFKAIKEIGQLYINTDNLAMVFGESVLITVSTNGNQTVDNLIENKKKLETLLSKGEDFICHYILDKEMDRYVEAKDILGEDFRKFEAEFLRKPGKDVLENLFTKELVLLELRQKIESTTDMLLNLIKPTDNYIQNDLIPYFRDVYDHSFKTTESLKTILGRINGMRNTYQSIVSMRMNETIRTLTILMAVMMPMTIVTGFYGMNVKLPLQENVHIYLYLAILMVFASGIIYLTSRKLGWIKDFEKAQEEKSDARRNV